MFVLISELIISEVRATHLDMLALAKFTEEGEQVRDTRALLSDAEPKPDSPEQSWQRILDARENRKKDKARAEQLAMDADFG